MNINCYPLLKFIAKPLVKLLWIGQVTGLKNIPAKGPVIIAANHQSYFDPVCIGVVCPRQIHSFAAEVFYKKWWSRFILESMQQIKIERYGSDKKESAKEAIEQAIRYLQKGEICGIFPEGTRSRTGKIQKAFTGVAKLSLLSKAPIIPIGIIGTYEIMSPHESFPHFHKSKIKIGKPMHFHQFEKQKDDPRVLRKITDQVMTKIAELSGQKYLFNES
jgi:1-acyl-sn-glycerol-3-phosphate acyltransferase